MQRLVQKPLHLLFFHYICSIFIIGMNIRDFFSFKKNFFFWGNLLAMLVVVISLIVIVFKWLDYYTEHNVSVKVPDVKGMSLVQAREELAKFTLVAVVSDSTYNKKQPGGIVLDINPVEGSVVKERRTVYLTINTSRPPMKVIPALADNSSLREAEARLLAMGFKLEENELVDGEKDWVYGIKHRGVRVNNGDEVPAGATLVLEVGSGDYHLEEEALQEQQETVVKPAQEAVVDDSWFE